MSRNQKYRLSDLLVDNELSNKFKTELTCGICLDIFDNPIQCFGGHSWCQNCIIESGRANCPICPGIILHQNVIRNIVAANLIGKLPCKCPSTLQTDKDPTLICNRFLQLKRKFSSISSQDNNETCNWTGEADLLESHLKICQQLLRPCSLAHNQCFFMGTLNSLERHYRNKVVNIDVLLIMKEAIRFSYTDNLPNYPYHTLIYCPRYFPVDVDFAFPDGSVHTLHLRLIMMGFKRCDIKIEISDHDETLDYTGTSIRIKDDTMTTENYNFVAMCKSANEMHLITSKGTNVVINESCIFPCTILNCWNECPGTDGELIPTSILDIRDQRQLISQSDIDSFEDMHLQALGEPPLYISEKLRLKVSIKCRRKAEV